MNIHKTHVQTHGSFYTLTILPKKTPYIIKSNSERAFIAASLQDIIQGRHKYRTIQEKPSTIELIAFSITRTRILLLFFAYTKPLAQSFGSQLINMLLYHPYPSRTPY